MKNLKQTLENLIEEATVDCYTHQECVCGFVTCMQDNLVLPVKAKLADIDVHINSVNTSRDSLRITAKVSREGKFFEIDLLSLSINSTDESILWIEAYRHWIEQI